MFNRIIPNYLNLNLKKYNKNNSNYIQSLPKL